MLRSLRHSNIQRVTTIHVRNSSQGTAFADSKLIALNIDTSRRNIVRQASSRVGHPPDVTRRTHDLESDDAAKKDRMYQEFAEKTLQFLHDQFEQPELRDFVDSVDLKEGVLEIQLLDDKGTIVLNKHYIHKQIWYSCPISGADYFDYSTTIPWISQRCKISLMERLAADVQILTGKLIDFRLPDSDVSKS